MVFQYINICQVPREMLKTSAYGLGFQHLPRDLANVNAWKSMFDPYIKIGAKAYTETSGVITDSLYFFTGLLKMQKKLSHNYQ